MDSFNKSFVKPSNIDFTNSQLKCIEDINDWYKNNKSNSYIISGSAGTGKTFLVKYLSKTMLKGKKICVVAPTHKAVRVIEKFTGLKGLTLHSLHGLRPNFNLDNFNIDKLQFEALADNKFSHYNVIICDESSMINDDLERLNTIRSTQYNTKIIYIGDNYQLKPIDKKSKLSKIFNNEFGYELTDIIRQKDNSYLLDLLVSLRKDVINESSNFINILRNNKIKITDENKGYLTVTNKDFGNLLIKYFTSEEFKDNTDLFRVGAYTKDRVQSWNKYIRSKIYSGISDILVKGDILMGYKTIVDEFLNPVIINSNDYIVVEVEKKRSDFNFDIFVTKLCDTYDKSIRTVLIVDHTSKTFNKYISYIRSLHHNAMYADVLKKGKLWKSYFNFKESFMTMIDFQLEYGNRKYIVDKEIDYGYSSTIHKLQGSTINTILLDILNMVYYSNKSTGKSIIGAYRKNSEYNPNAIDTRNRLIYTGLSRASNLAINLFY